MTPRISVGVPVYNGERYLATTLDSLLAQTFADFELIVCDNASTDRTEDIGRAYAARDPRVRYVRNPRNLGSTGNYRRAFELATGEYFRWSAADDLSGPEFLARCIQVLDAQPHVVLAYPKTRFIDESGKVVSEYDDRMHLQSPLPSERFQQVLERLGYVNALYGLSRTAVLRQTRLLGTYLASDVVFLAELSLYGTFWEIPEFLFYRRFHAEASSSMSPAQRCAFYAPARRRGTYLSEPSVWRHLWEYWRGVEQAPLASVEKTRLRLVLARHIIRGRDKFGRELIAVTRQWLADAFRARDARDAQAYRSSGSSR